MKTLHSIAIVAALGMSLLVGCSESDTAATEETPATKFAYVADMTGIT